MTPRFFRPLLFFAMLISGAARAQPLPDFDSYPIYHGPDLGLTFAPLGGPGTLRVWAPPAEALTLRRYADGTGGPPLETLPMARARLGTWTLTLPAGTTGFYTVQATIGGQARAEVPDPYARAVGLNGRRAAWLDPASAAPPRWADDLRPALAQPTDIIVGEAHLRDLTVQPQSGIRHKGRFLGLTEGNTRGPGNVLTGLPHLLELGITHLHLLPINDFNSVDEARPQDNQYNWGYDPLNYFVPEGSYSTNAADPAARIRELKTLVQTLHANELRLVVDVVFNHTADAGRSAFEQLVPGYYYRHTAGGALSNATACGNEVASERPMVRKFIVDCVSYWASQYHVDGFRFDLMGVLDVETMRAVRVALDLQDHSIFVYGEGWTAGPSPLPPARRATKANLAALPRVAAFGDELRDGTKGHYARHTEPGFAGGQPGLEESVKFGIVGAVFHPQIDYAKVNYSRQPWATAPGQCLNYVACHDDMVLWDKLALARPAYSEAERIDLDLLCATIVFTAQGVPFLPVGDEFLRTKQGASNSYNLPDSVNQLDWGRKAQYPEVFGFYKKLLALRRAHPAFRLPTQALVAAHLAFLPAAPPGTIAYELRDHAGDDAWGRIVVLLNGTRRPARLPVPPGRYRIVLRGRALNPAGLGEVVSDGAVEVAANAALLLVAR